MSADARHWNEVYDHDPSAVSWFQESARISLRLIESLALDRDDPILDVGGGASPLAGGLLDVGYRDLTVLDLSRSALDIARAALGERAESVTWLCSDLRDFEPGREYAVWHDRAVLHFLTAAEDQRAYTELAARSVRPGGHLIVGTFALDGPDRCSGLAVQRHDAASLGELFAPGFAVVAGEREEHHTPGGNVQPFTWVVARRRGSRAEAR